MKTGNNQQNEFLRISDLSEYLSCSFLTDASVDFPLKLLIFSFELFAGGNISWEKQGS